MILVTGATGNTGGVVAAQLHKRKVPFKVMVRSEKARKLLSGFGYQTVDGNFDQPETLAAVLREGFEKAYLVCTPDEQMLAREKSFLDAAKAAGVKHVVKLSAFMSAEDGPSTNLRVHGQLERQLRESGMAWTIVRPHGFMQTFVVLTLDFVKEAGVYLHFGGDGAMPLVDVRDVAEVAVKALTEPGHEGRSYDLTGPVALTFSEQAKLLAAAFARPVTPVKGSDAALPRAMKMMGVTPQAAEHATTIMRLCREHRMADKTDTLASLGIPPIDFATFAGDLAAGRTGGGNSFEPPNGLFMRAMGGAMKLGYRARFAVFGRPA